MKKIFAKAKANKLLQAHKTAKLNIGCGTDYKKGWINIDNNTDNNITKLDLNWDLRNPLPFGDNSVDFIFNEHFIEHLTVEDAQKNIKDCLRVLKPGGVLRIAVPDLRVVVNKYLHVDLDKDPTVKKYDMGFMKTKAERLNISFRWWGHEWLYDWEELRRRLQEGGFSKTAKCKINKSKYKELQNLETRDESLVVEAVK